MKGEEYEHWAVVVLVVPADLVSGAPQVGDDWLEWSGGGEVHPHL